MKKPIYCAKIIKTGKAADEKRKENYKTHSFVKIEPEGDWPFYECTCCSVVIGRITMAAPELFVFVSCDEVIILKALK